MNKLWSVLFGCLLLLTDGATAQRQPPATAHYCTPCNAPCDTVRHAGPGTCAQCQMPLQARPVSLGARVTAGQRKPIRHMSRKLRYQLDTLLRAAAGPAPAPGYAVGIFHQGKVVFAEGYGLANLDYNQPNTPNTVFNIASLSKQFTAACIALLVQRGALSLDDEVRRYVPAVGKYPQQLQVKHLVYMTSGLPEYHAQPRGNGLNWNMFDYFTVDTAIAVTLRQPALEFTPGTRWAYSNVNYMLLTKIVEKLSGQRFSEFARRELFEPLGMRQTFIGDDVTRVVPSRATGYLLRTPRLVEESQRAGFYLGTEGRYAQTHRNAPHYGGSGVFTSVNDWFRWDQNWYTRQLGGDAFYQLMHQRMPFAHAKTNDALGLVLGDFYGTETVWYAGGDIGFSSYVMRFPAQQLTVVCFSNHNDGQTQQLTGRIAELLRAGGLLVTAK